MRLNSKQQNDEAGFAIQLVIRTIMSHSPHEHTEEWIKAYKLLEEAQSILVSTGFYSDDFNPNLAAY